jgi:leucyl aminopeptidase
VVLAVIELAAASRPPVDADTVAVGLFAEAATSAPAPEVEALVASGEARGRLGALAVTHVDGRRWLVCGLGSREAWGGEAAREAAVAVHGRARELGARHLCWVAPDLGASGPLVEGTLLGAHRVRPQGENARGLRKLTVAAAADVSAATIHAGVVARAQNRARELQDAPANVLTPEALADRARALDGVEVEVLGPAGMAQAGMGALAAVGRGAANEPRLITARHEPPGATGPLLGWVGKAVTFDSGGYSLKPPARMYEMKFDMSGGAAVLEALAAVVELRLPVRVLAVVGAAENLVSGSAMRPGDIVRAADGTTIEVNNTDAEGRLVLADCLWLARERGAERLVDVATLTGGIITALGTVYAGLVANDDAWAAEVQRAAEAADELVWRLPLHPRYAKQIEGRYADLLNATPDRKGQPLTAAAFLHHFAGDVPWVHLDIAGVASGAGAPWAPKSGTGWGVRTLVALAERASTRATDAAAP